MTPGDRIGPYRIEGRLGAGGMGVVFLATDERLDRQVALKCLRSDGTGDAVRQRRFRGEARAVARLSHAAVVQLYDILETGDGDVIVMEYVPGVTLAERLADGPLPVDESLRLAAQVAEGLAAAHAAGLIHRDLKAENVRVTLDGAAKILDFGLALAWQGDGGTRLTGEGLAVGTCRAMSPEQSRGETLDPRSDLFALGVLMHELLTGVSPFAGATAAETVWRVCTYDPPSLDALVPALPPGAARLAQSLLEKDPRRRPASAADVAIALRSPHGWAPIDAVCDQPTASSTEAVGPAARPPRKTRRPAAIVGGVLVATLVVGAMGLHLWRAPLPLVRVAVPRIRVESEGRAAPGDAGLRVALIGALVGLDGVRVLAPEEVDPLSGTPHELARATAADEIVTGTLACDVAQCHVTVARLNGSDGSVRWTGTFAADPARPLLLREAADAYVRTAYDERPRRAGARAPDVSAEAYAEFVALTSAYERTGLSREAQDAYVSGLQSIRIRAPRFVEGMVAEAKALQRRFSETRDRADLAQAGERLSEARTLQPDDPRILEAEARVALLGQQLEAAETAIAALGAQSPGDPAALVLGARLAEKRGDAARALSLLEEAVRRRPSWRNLFELAAMEAGHGRQEAARLHLEQVLERFPESDSAQSLLAELELLSGDAARAEALYARLAERHESVNELSNLGTAQLLLRRFDAAEATFVRAARIAPANPFVALNLADATQLARGAAAARGLYQRALDLAGGDPGRGDDATPEWQLASVRAQSLAQLGRAREAVGEVQHVLGAAADNPQAQLEAALVYALTGERTSAVVSAGRALRGGVQPRWFELPAFDPLRSWPEFAALFASGDQARAPTVARR